MEFLEDCSLGPRIALQEFLVRMSNLEYEVKRMQVPSTAANFEGLRLGKAFLSVVWILIFPVGLALSFVIPNIIVLEWTHVMAATLWTGLDIFMGFVLGPILQRLEPPIRKRVITQLMPRMLFLMPIVSITVGWSGWVLGHRLGNFLSASPNHGWIIGAGVITLILTVQGLGWILPTNVRVFLETQKATPDFAKIGRLMNFYRYSVAFQGVLQFGIIVVMVRLAVG